MRCFPPLDCVVEIHDLPTEHVRARRIATSILVRTSTLVEADLRLTLLKVRPSSQPVPGPVVHFVQRKSRTATLEVSTALSRSRPRSLRVRLEFMTRFEPDCLILHRRCGLRSDTDGAAVGHLQRCQVRIFAPRLSVMLKFACSTYYNDYLVCSAALCGVLSLMKKSGRCVSASFVGRDGDGADCIRRSRVRFCASHTSSGLSSTDLVAQYGFEYWPDETNGASYRSDAMSSRVTTVRLRDVAVERSRSMDA